MVESNVTQVVELNPHVIEFLIVCAGVSLLLIGISMLWTSIKP